LATATFMTRADLLRLAACARRFLFCSSVSKSSTSVSMNKVLNVGCMMFLLQFSRSRRDGHSDVAGEVRISHPAAGKDLAHVVEHDHSVAQQAPPLVGVKGDRMRGIAVRTVSWGARGLV
jgi:hypothetical protein